MLLGESIRNCLEAAGGVAILLSTLAKGDSFASALTWTKLKRSNGAFMAESYIFVDILAIRQWIRIDGYVIY